MDATHPAAIGAMSGYDPLGNPGTAVYGGALTVRKTYTSRSWLSDQTASVPVIAFTRTDHYDYYANGTNKDLADSLLGMTNYTFDRLSRLTFFVNSTAGVNYGYDTRAHMTSHTQTVGSGYTFNFQADAHNHLVGLGYDGAGASTLTADGLNNHGYDAEQRIGDVNGSAGGETSYLYDPEGFRVAKQTSGAIVVQYLYAPDGTLTTTLGPDSKLARGSQYDGGEHLADYTAGTGAGGGATEMRLMDSPRHPVCQGGPGGRPDRDVHAEPLRREPGLLAGARFHPNQLRRQTAEPGILA